MSEIVLLSFTSLNSSGGVPRWNRDFIKCFPEAKHYSWDDVVKHNNFHVNIPEWSKADTLCRWLHHKGKVNSSSIIISDGFWGDWLSQLGLNVISVAHGIWSHLTKEDVRQGKKPEFPEHHIIQLSHRMRHLKRGKKIVAVSDFIADQMKLQWYFDSTVINNAIDLDHFKPILFSNERKKLKEKFKYPLIIHGVTTVNKGLDHIEALKRELKDCDVLLLDEVANRLGVSNNVALACADMVVQPSAFEGNSYFVLETMACNIPIVAYNVGLLYDLKRKGLGPNIGRIIDRKERSVDTTVRESIDMLYYVLKANNDFDGVFNPRHIAKDFSINRFNNDWKRFLNNECNITC